MVETKHHRTIRSFVLREGRLTKGQSLALEKHWQEYGLDFSKEKIDLDVFLGRRAPKILDIGSGMGDSTLQLAEQHPENDYLAIEVHKPGVGALIRQAVNKKIDNIRIANHDVMEVLHYQIMQQSLDEVYVFFPDPWHKKRHHKRRLINPPFLELLIPRLKSHGRLYIATDWADLAEHIVTVCDATSYLTNLAGKGNTSPRPNWRPFTKFENRGHRLEHKVWDFIYTKAN